MTTATKARPILFSGPMVRALLDGTKTMTRRIMKPQPAGGCHYAMNGNYDKACHIYIEAWEAKQYDRCFVPVKVNGTSHLLPCPFGKVGDSLWVTVDASGDSRTKSLMERFESRVFKPHGGDGCWEWFGRVNRKRYGVIRLGTQNLSTHRLAYEFAHDCKLTPEQHVIHSCDLQWCVNPAHLSLGSNSDNVADKVTKGRQPKICGERNGQSRCSLEDIVEIRRLYKECDVHQSEIAHQFNITQPQVSKIVNDKRWSHESVFPNQKTGSRLLAIESVRVERLWEISEADARAEGFPGDDPIGDFRRAWRQINGAESWDANPWAWVLGFRRVQP